MFLNRGMQRNNSVSPVILRRIDKRPQPRTTSRPPCNERFESNVGQTRSSSLRNLLVIFDLPPFALLKSAVLLKRPIRRGRHHQVHAIRREFIHCAASSPSRSSCRVGMRRTDSSINRRTCLRPFAIRGMSVCGFLRGRTSLGTNRRDPARDANRFI